MRFAACWTRSPRSAGRWSRPSCLRRADRPQSSPRAPLRRCWPAWSSSRSRTTRRRDWRPRCAGGREMLRGFTAIAADRRLGLITVLGVAQTFTRGCLTVFAVVVAIDLLGHGRSGRRCPQCGRRRRWRARLDLRVRAGPPWRTRQWVRVGIALFGAPLALIGVVPEQAAAIALLGLVGVGNALIDVGGFTMLARLADETVLARMFAGFEAILTLGVAPGGLLAPLLIERLGLRLALVAVGLHSAAGPGGGLAALRRLDGRMRVRDADIEILRGVPMLAVLPAATIEQLGAGLDHAEFAPRQVVFEQGERGTVLRRRVRPGRGSATDASSRRSGAATASARSPCSRPAANGHHPRIRGRAPVRERPAAPGVPDRRDRVSGQRGRRPKRS